MATPSSSPLICVHAQRDLQTPSIQHFLWFPLPCPCAGKDSRPGPVAPAAAERGEAHFCLSISSRLVSQACIPFSLAARATEADLTALRARLEQVEQQLLDLRTKPFPPPPTPSATKPKKTARPKPVPLSPPFSVLGVESRGGERFLAVAPHDSRSLIDVRLLHSGEQLGAWYLKVLEPNSAIFAVAAQPDQTVHLP